MNWIPDHWMFILTVIVTILLILVVISICVSKLILYLLDHTLQNWWWIPQECKSSEHRLRRLINRPGWNKVRSIVRGLHLRMGRALLRERYLKELLPMALSHAERQEILYELEYTSQRVHGYRALYREAEQRLQKNNDPQVLIELFNTQPEVHEYRGHVSRLSPAPATLPATLEGHNVSQTLTLSGEVVSTELPPVPSEPDITNDNVVIFPGTPSSQGTRPAG